MSFEDMSVGDGLEVEPVRGSGPARLGARAALEQRAEVADACACRWPTSSIVPTRTRFMWRMKASASIENSSTSPSRSQPARSTWRSKRVW